MLQPTRRIQRQHTHVVSRHCHAAGRSSQCVAIRMCVLLEQLVLPVRPQRPIGRGFLCLFLVCKQRWIVFFRHGCLPTPTALQVESTDSSLRGAWECPFCDWARRRRCEVNDIRVFRAFVCVLAWTETLRGRACVPQCQLHTCRRPPLSMLV